MTVKKSVDLELWRNDHTSIHLSGRLLGLVTDEHLALLMKSSEFRKRISTGPTMSLSQISDLNQNEINGKRLLIVAKEIDTDTKADPVLFISEKIDYISATNLSDDMAAESVSGSSITIQEVS